MIEDLDALEEIAEFLDSHTEFGKRYEFGEMLDQFRKSLLRELDYRQEASNLTTLRQQSAGVREHRRSGADRRLQHVARPHDGVRARQENHGPESARPHGVRRRRARRGSLPRLPRADSRQRLLPRRSASGERFPDRRLSHRVDRSRDGRPHHARHAGAVTAASARDRRRSRRRRRRHRDQGRRHEGELR